MLDDARVRAVLLACAYLLLVVHGLGDVDIVGDDEAREVGIVQDVLAGHWLWPRFNGEVIPDKPTLYHWLAAIPSALGGFSEVAVRLPSALAAAALVGWTAWLGARLLDPLSGLIAGVLLATTPALFTRARVARPDALLALLLAVAFGYAFLWWRERRARDATTALGAVGLGVLAKGPVAPVLFGAGLGLYLLWQRDLRRLRGLFTPAGVALLLGLGLAWYVLAAAGWGRAFVDEHLIGRYLRNLLGGLASGQAYSPKPLVYHLTFYPLHLPAIAMPWTPFLAVALVRLWRLRGFGDPRARFLVCWALAPVLVFTPAEWKLRYYLLPALPALALLTAPTVAMLLTAPLRPVRITRASVGAGVATLLVVVVATAVVLLNPDVLARSDRVTLEAFLAVLGGRAPAAAGLGMIAGMAAVLIGCQLWGPLATLVGAGALGWLAVGAPAVEAASSRRDSTAAFARAVAARVPRDQPLAFYGSPVRSVVVYLGRPVPSLRRRPAAITPGLAVIAFKPAYDALAQSGYVGPPLAEGAGRIGNIARGELVLAEGRVPPKTTTPQPEAPAQADSSVAPSDPSRR